MLGAIRATVPSSAPYAAKHVLTLHSLVINGGAISGLPDRAIHLVGYLGDTSAGGDYSSLDGQKVLRVALGADAGFEAYPLVDPVLVADITMNGQVTVQDATRLLQEVVGADRPEIPPLPALASELVLGGLDPVVALGDVDALPGETVFVPVTVDQLPAGLEAVELEIAYDANVLTVRDVGLSELTADFEFIDVDISEEGLIRVDTSTSHRLSPQPLGGVVLEIELRVRDDAVAGASALDLRALELDDGRYTLVPEPVPGVDPTDAVVRVGAPGFAAAAPKIGAVSAVSVNNQSAARSPTLLQPGPLPVADGQSRPGLVSTGDAPIVQALGHSVRVDPLRERWLFGDFDVARRQFFDVKRERVGLPFDEARVVSDYRILPATWAAVRFGAGLPPDQEGPHRGSPASGDPGLEPHQPPLIHSQLHSEDVPRGRALPDWLKWLSDWFWASAPEVPR